VNRRKTCLKKGRAPFPGGADSEKMGEGKKQAGGKEWGPQEKWQEQQKKKKKKTVKAEEQRVLQDPKRHGKREKKITDERKSEAGGIKRAFGPKGGLFWARAEEELGKKYHGR